jgi:uncharacterized membrane protein
MKVLVEFIKTTMLGGVLVWIPLVLCYLMFSELLEVLIAMARPVAEMVTIEGLDNDTEVLLIAILILLICSFGFGLALRSVRMQQFGNWFENAVLSKFPIYRPIKSLSHSLLGAVSKDSYTCGILEDTSGVRELVYIVEDPGNGYLTVLTPWAPTGLSGAVKIVKADMIKPIDASVGDATIIMSNLGMGMHGILNRD